MAVLLMLLVFGGKKNNLILNFPYDDARDNYLLLMTYFFLLIKIFSLILAPTLQTVPYPSSFFMSILAR